MAETAARSALDLLTEARELTDRILDQWAGASAAKAPGGTARRWRTRSRRPGKRVRAALLLASYRAVGR